MEPLFDSRELRRRLRDVVVKSPESFVNLAKNMGVNHQTLSSFLGDSREPHRASVIKILEYVERMEKK